MKALLFDVFGTCVDWRGNWEIVATDFVDLASQCGA
jgi:hypothetical protein